VVSIPVIHVITWLTTRLLTPKGRKAEFAWLVDSQRTPHPQSGHMSTIDQAQIKESPPPKTDVLTTEPRRRCLINGAAPYTERMYGIYSSYHQCCRI